MTDSSLGVTQRYDAQMLVQRLLRNRWIMGGAVAQNIGGASAGDLYFVIYAPGIRLKNSIPADSDWFENDSGKP